MNIRPGIEIAAAATGVALTLVPTGVSAVSVAAGSAGDDVQINSAISQLGATGGGTILLRGTFNTGAPIVNLESDVHLISDTGASIVPAYDFTASQSNQNTWDWAVVTGRTAGVAVTSAAIASGNLVLTLTTENGLIGPNDQVYLATTVGATLPTGVNANQPYYLVNTSYWSTTATTMTAQLSLTKGGSPIAVSSVAGIGSLFLFYTWFQPSNVNTGTGYITLPSVGQKLPTDRPIVFRSSDNTNTHLPGGLLGAQNLFYAINESAVGDGTYKYQFSRSRGGAAVTLTNTGTAGLTFSAIPVSRNQVLKNITVDATALSGMNPVIGAIQIQRASLGVTIDSCPTITSPAGYAINNRGSCARILNNGIVNTVGGINTFSGTSGMEVMWNAFSGAAGGADINLAASCTYNVCVNNKLTAGAITDGGTGDTVSPNF